MLAEVGVQTPSRIIPPTGQMRVPIHMYVNEAIQPDATTINQLRRLAAVDCIDQRITTLPDIHAKGRNPSPTGVVVVSRDHLVPMAIDKGINCGMRVVATELQASDLSTDLLDNIFAELAKVIPGRQFVKPIIGKEHMMPLLLNGGRWAVDHFGILASELDNIEKQGSVFDGQMMDEEQLLRAVPNDVFKKGYRALGSLGGGNHFLEMQEITEILDPEKAALLGLREGQIVFMLHTGSRRVGSTIMRYYSQHAMPVEMARWKKLAERKWDFHLRDVSPKHIGPRLNYILNNETFFGICANSSEGQRLYTALQAGYNFGFVNRMVITHSLRQTLQQVLADKSLQVPLLYDCSHVSIQPEEHDGETVWVHRHGASQALPPSAMSHHPVYSYTGQPLPIPGSMGDESYIGVATEGAAKTYHSVNHGAGRVLDKPDAKAVFSQQAVEADLRAKNIRLYRTGSGDLAEQAPQSFKSVSDVVQTMEAFDLARLVARVRPVAVLKG